MGFWLKKLKCRLDGSFLNLFAVIQWLSRFLKYKSGKLSVKLKNRINESGTIKNIQRETIQYGRNRMEVMEGIVFSTLIL